MPPIHIETKISFEKLRACVANEERDKCLSLLDEVIAFLDIGKQQLAILAHTHQLVKEKVRVGRLTETEKAAFTNNLNSLIKGLENQVTQGDLQKTIHHFLAARPTTRPSLVLCPTCQSDAVRISDLGKLHCSACDAPPVCYHPPRFHLAQHLKMTAEEGRTFEKLMLLCRHEIILGNYETAIKLALEAIEYGYDVPMAWEYHALAYFYAQDNKGNIITDGAKQIMADLKTATSPIKDIRNPRTLEVREFLGKALFAAVDVFYQKKEATRADIIQYLKVWAHCFEIYDAPVFLETVIEELLGFKKMEWFELAIENGDVKPSAAALALDFNPMTFLRIVLNKLYGHDNFFLPFIENIKIKITEEQANDTFERYMNTLRNNPKKHLRQNTREEIESVLYCFKKWQYIFKINGNKLSLLLPIRELSCKGKISWYELGEDGSIQNKANILALGFDALKALKMLISWEGNLSFDTIEREIKAYLAENLSEETDKLLRKLVFVDGLLSDKSLAQLAVILNNWAMCFQITDNQAYVEKALLYLTEESRRPIFYVLHHKGVANRYKSETVTCSILGHLRQFCTWSDDRDWDYQLVGRDIQKTLIDLRFDALFTSYQKAIAAIKDQGTTEESVNQILASIGEALDLFQISKEPGHLLWAIDELHDNNKGSNLIWLYQNRKGDVIQKPRITEVDTITIWKELVRNIQTVHLYAPPVLKRLTLWLKFLQLLRIE